MHERKRETWKIRFEVHSQLNWNKRVVYIPCSEYSSGVPNISNDNVSALHAYRRGKNFIRKGEKKNGQHNNQKCLNILIRNTCLTRVTAVVPLQKQSIVPCILSSLSMTLKAFRNDSFSVWKISRRFPTSPTSAETLGCSSAVPSEFMLPAVLRLISLRTSALFMFTSQWALSLRGSESLTLFATKWPKGPWPSKTPQKTVSFLEPKFWNPKLQRVSDYKRQTIDHKH